MTLGYSLLELLVVLAVVALVAIGAGFAFGDGSGRTGTNDVTRQVGEVLEIARERAVARGGVVSIRPAEDGKALLIDDERQPETNHAIKMQHPILVDGEGFSSGGTIELRSPDGVSLILTVSPLTGSLDRADGQ